MHGVRSSLDMAVFSSQLDGWLNQLLSPAANLPTSLLSYVMLLKACHSVLSLVKETGYEAALHVLGLECIQAVKQQSHAAFEAASAASSAPTAALLFEALTATVNDLPAVMASNDVESAPLSGSTFPKFQMLVRFLVEQKASKSSWHGMVFVKQRQGAAQLTRMLQNMPDLAGINFYPFMGDGKSGNRAAASTGCLTGSTGITAARQGMNLNQKKATFQRFLEADGREVLVATSAAEEGINVPRCEFVVCYTAVESGRERTQQQGRARAKLAKFVEFIEIGSSDSVMQSNGQHEQACALLAQRLHVTSMCD